MLMLSIFCETLPRKHAYGGTYLEIKDFLVFV